MATKEEKATLKNSSEAVNPVPEAEVQKQEIISPASENLESGLENVMGIPEGVITVVIPYVKELAQGKELLFALRSIAANIRQQCNVVIIGDREDWFEDENLLFIEHKRVSDNPQVDVLEKLKLAIDSPMVSDSFIWSNDDIYFISPVMLADIQVLKTKGILNPAGYKGAYAENMQRTIDLLGGGDIPDFGTHTPYFFSKERLVELFEKYPELSTGGYLLSSVYFNTFFPGFVPLLLDWKTDNWVFSVVTPNPNEAKFRELVGKNKFLNNAESGYSEWLESELLAMFPDKSPFEL